MPADEHEKNGWLNEKNLSLSQVAIGFCGFRPDPVAFRSERAARMTCRNEPGNPRSTIQNI
jgi:hypothetical protein